MAPQLRPLAAPAKNRRVQLQHPHGGSQPSETPVSKDLTPVLLISTGKCVVHVQTGGDSHSLHLLKHCYLFLPQVKAAGSTMASQQGHGPIRLLTSFCWIVVWVKFIYRVSHRSYGFITSLRPCQIQMSDYSKMTGAWFYQLKISSFEVAVGLLGLPFCYLFCPHLA